MALALGKTYQVLKEGFGEKEILEQKGGNNLYLLDEPTVGLHMRDV